MENSLTAKKALPASDAFQKEKKEVCGTKVLRAP